MSDNERIIQCPDTAVYCLASTKVVRKGRIPGCGHGDYRQTASEPEYGEFECVHCGEVVRVEVWQ